MYNLRKRKTAEQKKGGKEDAVQPKPTKKQRTSTGKRPREHELDQAVLEDEVDDVPIPPKPKHKAKSEYQQARINRAKHQRMYLIDVRENTPDNWAFTVQGHSGSYYHLNISRSLSCTCPDFYRQRKPCKHLYFIVCQVAQFDQLLERMPNKLTMTLTNLILLSGMLRVRLGARLKSKGEDKKEQEKPKEELHLGDDKDCAICFEELEEKDDLKQCKQCKKFFHDGCLKAWLVKNTTCPLCRYDLSVDLKLAVPAAASDLNLDGLDASHPLFHLSRVNLIAASLPT